MFILKYHYYLTDKIAPQVTKCPDSKTVFTKEKTTRVFWFQPIFTDNTDVVSISRSHAPGQLFGWGDHVVTYIAKDAFNNVAKCIFRIYVTRMIYIICFVLQIIGYD